MTQTITLTITLAAAAAAALINVWLAMRVGRVRQSEKVALGDGGNEHVTARMRAHANFTEYTPFVLILVALIELARGSMAWLWVVVALYLAARIAHAIGMDGVMKLRIAGIVVTFLTLIGLAGYALYILYTR